MAQVDHGDGRRKKIKLEKMVATKHLRLAMETDEEEKQEWRMMPYTYVLYKYSVDICV